MLRLSKITDYGIVVLAELAQRPGTGAPRNARDVASVVDLPLPIVSKVLKSLARTGVLESQRGAKGGYCLSRRPDDVTVSEMIDALEGPVALTECSVAADLCQHEGSCAVRTPWQVINRVVREALGQVTLADLIDPTFPSALKVMQFDTGSDVAETDGPATRARD